MTLTNQNNTTTLPVVKYGDPILRKKVAEVEDFTDIPLKAQQMFDTMYEEGGIGLAANLVGWSLNLLVLDTSSMEEEEDAVSLIMVNSKIIKEEGCSVMEEGCLSVPEIRAEIERPESITLQYLDENENSHTQTFNGLISRVIQHEMDHLNGKFFVDYLPPSKRMLINKRLMEISKTGKPSTGIIL